MSDPSWWFDRRRRGGGGKPSTLPAEVYLAEDTKLDRKVALKVLPPELAESEERRSRVTREAKAIAALNHPNIVTVYSVEEDDGVHFITMELVCGKTLSELLPKSGFSLNKFFDIAIPLTDAVAAAHQEGITHRDLKPDNVLMGDDGRIKVCDFGLAKFRSESAAGSSSELPTKAMTQEGLIVGTVAYMSPEQAEGKAIDTRSDIFSLGIVLYEMLTGRRPFEGDSPASILSSILRDTPRAVTELEPSVPRELGKLVKRCLAKDPIRRYQTAIDVRNELEETKHDIDSGELVTAASPSKRPSPTRRVVAAMALLAALGGILFYTLVSPEADSTRVPRLANPVQVTSDAGVEDSPTWSPDGQTLAYTALASENADGESENWDIWVARVGGERANRTADHTGFDTYPSWSPDGSQIAFWSDRDGSGYFVMPALGGLPRKVISTTMHRVLNGGAGAPRWSANGEELSGLVHSSFESFIEIVSLRTRESRRLALPEIGAFDLSWSPHGRFFAYVDIGHPADINLLKVVRLFDEEAIPLSDGLTRIWSPTWSEDGRALYFLWNRGESMDLWQQELDDDGTPLGEPQPVTVGIGMRHAVFSADGTKLAYSKGRLVRNLWRVPILEDRSATWADAQQLTFDEASLEFVHITSDGERLLFGSDRRGNMDLWVMPAAGGDMIQITTDPAPDWRPRLSPDGTKVSFYSYRSGNREAWVMPLSGGPARQITDGAADGVSSWGAIWSADGGEFLVGKTGGGETAIWLVPSEGGEGRPIEGIEDANMRALWTPDGQVAFTKRTLDGGLWQVPAEGGIPELLIESVKGPVAWSSDGQRLFFWKHWEPPVNIWAQSMRDGSVRAMTDLAGRYGTAFLFDLATNDEYLYFVWQEDIGDIWVMDVVE